MAYRTPRRPAAPAPRTLGIDDHPLCANGRRRRTWRVALGPGRQHVLRNHSVERDHDTWRQALTLSDAQASEDILAVGVEYRGSVRGRGALFEVSETADADGVAPDTLAAWHAVLLGLLAATPEAQRAGGLLVRLPGFGVVDPVPWDHEGNSAGVRSLKNGDRLVAVPALPDHQALAKTIATATWPTAGAMTPWSASDASAWLADLSRAQDAPDENNVETATSVLVSALEAACRAGAVAPHTMHDLLVRAETQLPSLTSVLTSPWLSTTEASSDGIRLRCNILAWLVGAGGSGVGGPSLRQMIDRPWREFLEHDLPDLTGRRRQSLWGQGLALFNQPALDVLIGQIPGVAMSELTPRVATKLLASPKGPIREWALRALAVATPAATPAPRVARKRTRT